MMTLKTKINEEILRLSIPNILSNISVPLLSTVDTILMGGLSSMHLAAVGIGSMIFNIIYWNFGFLRMGTTGITAQHFGAQEKDGIWLSFLRAALLAFVLALLIVIFQSPLFSACSWGLNISEDLQPLALEYFQIRIWAAPASLMLMVIMGWMFGVQNAIFPLILTLLINITNIIVSYHLVVNMKMDISGVAYGTVAAQYLGMTIGLGIITVRYKKYIKGYLVRQLGEWSAYKRFIKINTDLFLRTVCLTFAFGFFYSQSSKISDTVLAVNVVLMQFVNWMSYGIDGFAYATESLVGKYKGAKNDESLLLSIKQSFLWAGLVSIFYALCYYIFGMPLFSLFSTDQSLYGMGQELLGYIAIFPLLAFASYIWDGVYVGMTATTSMRNTMIWALVVYLLSFYILPIQPNGAHIWIALSIFIISRAVFQYLYFRKYGLELS